MAMPVMQGVNKSNFVAFLNKFRGTGHEVGLERKGSNYWLHQYLAPQTYGSVRLISSTTGGKTINAMEAWQIRKPVVYVDDEDGSISYTGTWTHGLASSSAYGGTYSRSLTAGSTLTWTTPSGVHTVGMRAFSYTSSGVAKVEIDGDATLANLLPTAQDSVDAGRLPNTILVANGGSLNPTDRIWDQYYVGVEDSGKEVFTTSLAVGVHTIKLTVTGYKESGSSNAYVRPDAFFYVTNNTTLANANSTRKITDILSTSSDQEYVFMPLPTGASDGTQWVGNIHGNDNQITLTFKINGVSVTPTDLTVYSGSLVEITRTSQLFHPDLGATVIGTSSTVYTINCTSGLWVNYSVTWLVAGTMNQAFSAMCAVDNLLDRGSSYLSTSDYNLSNNDGDYHPNLKDSVAYLWDADGIYAVLMYISDVVSVTKNWQSNGSYFLATQDRSGDTLNKIYLYRVAPSNPEAYAINDVWSCNANYRLALFANANILAKGAPL